MKKTITFALAITLALSLLTACGGGSDGIPNGTYQTKRLGNTVHMIFGIAITVAPQKRQPL